MKKGRKKRSPRHTTPPEFTEAEKAHGTRRWREEAERDRAHAERMRGVKMPSHPAPLTLEQRLDKSWR